MDLSIVIVNYNGFIYIRKCIESILASNTNNYQIIVVDNGSSDGSVSMLEDTFGESILTHKLKIISLDENFGPAYARNVGVANATGRFIGFLDNDTFVDKDWAVSALNAFEKDSGIGCIQCKLLLAKEPNKIDYVGEFLGQNGFLVQRTKAGTLDDGSYDTEVEILAAKSAGMFIRKDAFTKSGGFDSDYFIYVEETDLGWRVLLSGYRNIFLPSSVVWHEFGTSSIILDKKANSYNAKFHGSKNYILTLFKNLELLSMIKILPIHIFLWVGLAWYSLLRRDLNSFIWIHKGILWNLLHIGTSIKKRNVIQKRRVASDTVIFRSVMVKRPLSYFLNKVLVKHKVGNAEGFIKSK